MQSAIVTVKNYRCFDQEAPLRLEIGRGFTALVGPNNSGKSSSMKLFHELYDLWRVLPNDQTLTQLIRGSPIGNINYRDVYDPQELFYDGNSEPLSIEIEVPDKPGTHGQNGITGSITKIRLECHRRNPLGWFAYFYYGTDHQLIARNENAGFTNPLRAVWAAKVSVTLQKHLTLKSGYERFISACI